MRSRAQGGGVVGVRAEGIGCGGGESCDFFWGREGGSLVGGDRGQGWTGLRAWEE